MLCELCCCLTPWQAVVVGFGSIGKKVARSCIGLGMQVVATRASITNAVDETMLGMTVRVHPAQDLTLLVSDAVAIIVCVPGTPETEDLIDAALLQATRPGAVLVNIGRGNVVNEEALYLALKDGPLLAAGIDVWYRYPKDYTERSDTQPSKFDFASLDNVVMSPHRGGSVGLESVEGLRVDSLSQVLIQYARLGLSRLQGIDVQRGY